MAVEWIAIFFKRLNLFIFRESGKEGEREGEKHYCVVAWHTPRRGTCPATQAYALTGNPDVDLLVCGNDAQSTESHQLGLYSNFK